MTSQSTNFITKATNAAASLVSVAGSLANTAAESFGYYGEKTVLGTFGTLEKVPQGTRSHLPFAICIDGHFKQLRGEGSPRFRNSHADSSSRLDGLDFDRLMYSLNPTHNEFCTGPPGNTRKRLWTAVKTQLDRVDAPAAHRQAQVMLTAYSQARGAPDMTPPTFTLDQVTGATHVAQLAMDCEALCNVTRQEKGLFDLACKGLVDTTIGDE